MAASWLTGPANPITLPDGRTLSTLRDAGDYITSLPKAEQDSLFYFAGSVGTIGAGSGGILRESREPVISARNFSNGSEYRISWRR